MNITFISDTHGQHHKIQLHGGDILIHAGDVSNKGTTEDAENFIDWFSSLDYTYKIFIAGNHDFYFDGKLQDMIQRSLPQNTFYLCDRTIIIEGIFIHGSPITPYFYNWAFNRHRGNDIKKHWQLIPQNTDILITHGPPLNILDKTMQETHVGCADLLKKVQSVQPKYHLFGHIHEANGIYKDYNTTFINGSMVDRKGDLIHKPFNFEY